MSHIDITVHVGTTEDGLWVAATSESPYFCFTTSSESESLGLAQRAVSFYRGARTSQNREQVEVVPKSQKVIRERDLACA